MKYGFIILAIFLGSLGFMGNNASEENIAYPLDQFNIRSKLLTFCLYVTPSQNPIDPPERFIGYHAALDIEMLEDEKDKEVMVFAICSGQVIFSNTAEGYGGLLVQKCNINNQNVTVIYGHLDPESLVPDKQNIRKGDVIGVLAQTNTPESGLTRKHLHLGIHKGDKVQILGYVQREEDLEEYIDPMLIF